MGDGSPHARGHWEGERWGTGEHGGGRFAETCPYGAKQVILVEGEGTHKAMPLRGERWEWWWGTGGSRTASTGCLVAVRLV